MIAVPVTHKGLEAAIRNLQKKLAQDGILREIQDRDKGKRERERRKAERAKKRRKKLAHRRANEPM